MSTKQKFYTQPIVVFGADLQERGQELGPQTRKRCDRAAMLYWELARRGDNSRSPYIVLPTGWLDLWGRYPNQRHSMADMMADYLKQRHNVPANDCVIDAVTVGLKQEFRAAVLTSLWHGGPFHVRLVAGHVALWRLRWLSLWIQRTLSYSFVLRFSFMPA